MSHDNRRFNVSGESREFLEQVINIALKQAGYDAAGYRLSVKHGFIVLWHADKPEWKFPSEKISSKTLTALIWEWLETSPKIEASRWDGMTDHDGDNESGWRVYCEDWGHVDGDCYAMFAVKPIVLRYGK